jgi:rhodanese-related sulfurtransferase
MQTSAPDVYAVGDAVAVKNFVTGEPSFIPLAGPANKQGRIAADNICGIPSEYKGTQGSSVLKLFDMTVATTGLNEKSASAAGYDYDKTYTYSASHASYYPGASMMSVKVLWDKATHKILGAQIVGFDGVDKRMDVIATAMRLGAKVTDLAELELCYAPPFGSAKDPVNMVGFVAENVITGKIGQFFWHDVEKLPRDGSVTLLDTRTNTEVARGRIDGFMHIPLDSLRERIHEIPTGKPVYVHCHSGLRSYIACRILAGNGFECYNLAGGWRLYESVINERTVPEYVCTECK